MSTIMKVFLLLAVIACISEAQIDNRGQQCLCHKVKDRIGPKRSIKDIQIYPATIFCDNVEIVVTENSGLRYCLNPKLRAMQKLVASIIKRSTSTTASPAEHSSTTGSPAEHSSTTASPAEHSSTTASPAEHSSTTGSTTAAHI